jgi:hypothetical protein
MRIPRPLRRINPSSGDLTPELMDFRGSEVTFLRTIKNKLDVIEPKELFPGQNDALMFLDLGLSKTEKNKKALAEWLQENEDASVLKKSFILANVEDRKADMKGFIEKGNLHTA